MQSDPSKREFHQWQVPHEIWLKLKPLAREMRHAPTATENLLWQQIRNKHVMGVKFRRQHAIDRFNVDFYSHEAKIIIEVDGLIHEQTKENDQIRQEILEALGYKVLRVPSEEVVKNISGVIQEIMNCLNGDA